MRKGAPRPGRRQPGRRGPRRTPDATREITGTVREVGREGDGLVREGDSTVAIPYALAGERVTARITGRRGDALAIDAPSAERVEPACTHHGRVGDREACGACALQHWRREPYEAWKRDLLVSALARAGLDVTVDPLVPCPPAARRRLVLAAQRTAAGTVLGFHAARSDRIVAMRECTIALPAIVEALPALRALCDALVPTGASAKVAVLASEAGLDRARRPLEREPDAAVPRRRRVPRNTPRRALRPRGAWATRCWWSARPPPSASGPSPSCPRPAPSCRRSSVGRGGDGRARDRPPRAAPVGSPISTPVRARSRCASPRMTPVHAVEG